MNIIKQATYNKKDYSIEGREHLYKGFIQVEKVQLRHRLFHQDSMIPTIQRELIHRPEAAGVLIYSHQQQKFALIEQFRIGAMDDIVSPWQLEIIAGVLDADESPESCIRRESLEESGCELSQLHHIFSFYPSAGACNEIFHLYTAQAELPETGGIFGVADEGENIQLHILDYAVLDELLTGSRLCNAPIIIALQWLKQHISSLNTL